MFLWLQVPGENIPHSVSVFQNARRNIPKPFATTQKTQWPKCISTDKSRPRRLQGGREIQGRKEGCGGPYGEVMWSPALERTTWEVYGRGEFWSKQKEGTDRCKSSSSRTSWEDYNWLSLQRGKEEAPRMNDAEAQGFLGSPRTGLCR